MSEVTISRSMLAASELPVYSGVPMARITLVDNAGLAERAMAELLAVSAIGFDTESKPTFRKGEVSTGPHLVQLATDDHVFLFPVLFAMNHEVLRRVLAAPNLLKVGFGLGNDRTALRSRLGIELTNVLDLGEVLRGPGHRGTVGAKVAVAHYFGQKFQKSKKSVPVTGPVHASMTASCYTPPTMPMWHCRFIGLGCVIRNGWNRHSSRRSRQQTNNIFRKAPSHG